VVGDRARCVDELMKKDIGSTSPIYTSWRHKFLVVEAIDVQYLTSSIQCCQWSGGVKNYEPTQLDRIAQVRLADCQHGYYQVEPVGPNISIDTRN